MRWGWSKLRLLKSSEGVEEVYRTAAIVEVVVRGRCMVWDKESSLSSFLDEGCFSRF